MTTMIDERSQGDLQSCAEVGQRDDERTSACNKRRGKPLQAPRSPNPEHRPHQDREIPSGERDEIALMAGRNPLAVGTPCCRGRTSIRVRDAVKMAATIDELIRIGVR
jgi:hypothetical protein